jgi:hypothetical protein
MIVQMLLHACSSPPGCCAMYLFTAVTLHNDCCTLNRFDFRSDCAGREAEGRRGGRETPGDAMIEIESSSLCRIASCTLLSSIVQVN